MHELFTMNSILSSDRNAQFPSPAAEIAFQRRLNRVVLFPLLFMFLLVIVLFWQLSHLLSVTQLLEQTDQTIIHTSNTRKLLVDMQTGLRGYLLVNNRRFLEPYDKADKQIQVNFEELSKSFHNTPRQQERLEVAVAKFLEWKAFATKMIRWQNNNTPVNKSLAIITEGNPRYQLANEQLIAIQSYEETVRNARKNTVNQAIPLTAFGTVSVAVAFGGILAFLVRKELFQLSDSYEEVLKTTFNQGQKLQESFEEFRPMANTVPQMIWTTDSSGAALFLNRRWCEYTGKKPEDGMGEGWKNILYPQDQERVETTWLESLRTGQLYECEYRMLRASDSTYRWQLARAVPLHNSEGQVTKWFGCTLDIEDQRHIEKVLQDRAEELHSLAQNLQLTTNNLKKRNKELDQFTYVISHDLKAPLRAVSNLSQWIEEDIRAYLSEENSQQMQLLRSRVQRMENLINGLLQYARVGRAESNYQTIHVENLLQEMIDSIDPPATFQIKIAPEMPVIIGEAVLLSQVFANLINNAIKHHNRSEGNIEITSISRGNFYEFTVKDDGPGIDPCFHDKIFEIFKTLKSRDTNESTGIGLSIVKKIIESQGGTITVESDGRSGTKFRFTWPEQQD